jgi:DNA polymerase-3 subunit alpha
LKIIKAKAHSGFLPFPEGDIQLKANKFLYALAKRHGIKVLYSDYAFYATPEDKAVQDVRLSQDDIKEHTKRHMQTSDEAVAKMRKMGLSEADISAIFEENNAWAKRFDNFSLSFEYRLPKVEGDKSPIQLCMDIIKNTGRLPNDPVYVERLRYEMSVLANNGKIDLIPYFLPIRDVLDFYDRSGRLTGPARGSAGGSLFMYLMGITHVDPIRYKLSFERFLSLDRILNGDMPDVDVDLVDREPLVGADGRSGYLFSRWGDKAAQISTRIQLRLKSAIRDVNRYLNGGTVDPEIEKLSKALPPPPQGVSDKDFVFGFEDSDGNHIAGLIEVNPDLQRYAAERPKEWDLVQRCLGISRQNSKHASAFVIADIPISEVVPVFMGNITQYEAKSVEKCKLIKYDFLVVNQLKDIEGCINRINKKNGTTLKTGHFTHKGKELYIWDLPEEEEVFRSIWNGDTETLFQINTQSMIPFVMKIKPRSVADLAIILALVRPGPLDFVDPDTGLTMAEEYIERREGRGTIKIPELAELLPETYGVLVYQESVSLVAKEIGKMRPSDAEELRRVFSKKQKAKALAMKPLFMEGAIKTVGKEKAEMIWSQMETSSRYSFNLSHATGYSMITYACMYLRYHYPMEWWASVLTNADEGEISTTLFKHVRDKVIPPDINLSSNEMEIDYERNKIRAKLTVMKGLGETVAEPIIKNAPYSDIKDFIRKKVAGPSLTQRLIHVGVMDSLFPKDSTLLEKLQAYEDAVLQVAYEDKIAAGKKAKPPAKGKVDPQYLSMSPLQDFIAKKMILPTLPMNLSSIVSRFASIMNEGTLDRPMFSDDKGRAHHMLTGDQFFEVERRAPFSKPMYFCVPAYIIDMKEFSFSQNEKKALKMTVDIDGRISERVMWPAWGENVVSYPKELKRYSVVLLFMGLKEDRTDCKIFSIKVLS